MIDEAVYATGVLDKEVHSRLVANLSQFAREANVPKHMIWTPLAEYCGPREVEWVRNLNQHVWEGVAGMVYVGKHDPAVLLRMSAIGGAVLRNFVSVRMASVGLLVDEFRNEAPRERVLLINDFHSSKTQLPKWQVGLLLAMMQQRYANELLTVIYADSLDAVEQDYGNEMAGLIRQHYTRIEQK